MNVKTTYLDVNGLELHITPEIVKKEFIIISKNKKIHYDQIKKRMEIHWIMVVKPSQNEKTYQGELWQSRIPEF